MDPNLLHGYRYRSLEEKINMNRLTVKSVAQYIALSLPLAIPIAAIIYLDGQVLADGDFIDPVELYKSHPLCMNFVHWNLVIALILAFTPFKRLSSMTTGIALGAFGFHGIDLYSQLKDLSDMGLSKQPLIEMIEISTYGKWLILICALSVTTQIIYAIAVPLMRLKKAACNNTDGLKVRGSK